MTPTDASTLRTTSGAPIDLDRFAAAGGTLTLDGAPVATGALAMASGAGDTYRSDDLTSLVRQALAGSLGGSFSGPHSFRQAVDRICECDPLDVGLRTRARAAGQVPIRLSRVVGSGQRDRERTRMALARGAASAGALTLGTALRLPSDGADAPEAVALPLRNAAGRTDPHGALALAVRMQAMHDEGELEEVTDHPVLDALHRPNGLTTTTWDQLLDAVVVQRVAWGEVFVRPTLRAYGLGLGAPPELFLVEDPSAVTVVLNEARNRLEGYDLAKHGGAERDRTRDGQAPMLEADELVHVKDIDPTNHLRGRSHMRSQWVWSALYLMAARWNAGLIKNGAKPSGILARRDGRAMGGRQRERAQEDAKSRSGPENAGKTMVDGDLVWNRVGLDPREMDWETAQTMAGRRCSTGVGVDPILQGFGEYSTYNNHTTAMARLYTEAALPDLAWLLGGFNEGVLPLLARDGEELVLWADPTEIPALRTDALDLSKTLKNSSWLREDEKRVASGWPAEGGPGERGNAGDGE